MGASIMLKPIDAKTNDEEIEVLCECSICGGEHIIKKKRCELSDDQLKGIEPFANIWCPNVTWMYRALSFNFDTRANILRLEGVEKSQEPLKNSLKSDWGSNNFDKKLKRFMDLDFAYLGLPEEYFDLLQPIVSAYCCGYYYPSIAATGALGERILNRLILKTRDYFKESQHYRKVYNKQSFNDWVPVINILKEWGIISEAIAEKFMELKKYRNDSIHYNADYNFEENTREAIKILAEIINLQFNYLERKDLFWLFYIPGEIWVKSTVVDQPFVKEFVLPNCLKLTPYCEPTSTPRKRGESVPTGKLTDIEFLELRKNRIEEKEKEKHKLLLASNDAERSNIPTNIK